MDLKQRPSFIRGSTLIVVNINRNHNSKIVLNKHNVNSNVNHNIKIVLRMMSITILFDNLKGNLTKHT